MTEFRMPDSWYEPPDVPEATDDPGTACLGWYPATRFDDAYTCLERTTCCMCGGVLCVQHDDDIADCGNGPAHEKCHDAGCSSSSCAQDRRDDAILARDEEERGR